MFSHHPVVILIPKGEESESEMASDKPKIMQLICRIGVQTQSRLTAWLVFAAFCHQDRREISSYTRTTKDESFVCSLLLNSLLTEHGL